MRIDIYEKVLKEIIAGLGILAFAYSPLHIQRYKIYMPDFKTGNYIYSVKRLETPPVGWRYVKINKDYKEGVVHTYRSKETKEWLWDAYYLICNDETNKLPFGLYDEKKRLLYLDKDTDKAIDNIIKEYKGSILKLAPGCEGYSSQEE